MESLQTNRRGHSIMSGSLRWFNYISDAGTTFAILADKSNIAAVNPSGVAAPGSLPISAVPRNIRVRYALFSDTTGLIKRRVPVLTPTDVSALSSTLSFVPQGETATVRLSSIRGEKINLPKLADTGQTT